ncbi:MAG: hypothetical protein IV090_15115 [Candidatus Sericytochromatia bacterium]|nr:hypothetical protein [Candidatus Sericytochromatia bacterium]
MIISAQRKSLSGFEVVIEAALKAGSQSYFAAPSPFQALLLNEGAMRFEEHHGSFIQAESPAAALAMAMGASAVGSVPLVTVNEQDFLQLQEVLSYCCLQSRPLVLVVVANGPPGMERNWLQFQSLAYFFQPLLGTGSPLVSYLPSSLQELWQHMGLAFDASLKRSQPVLLLLDPLLLMQQGPVQLSPLPSVKQRERELTKNGQSLMPYESLSICLEWPCEHVWLAMGVLGEWLLQLHKSDWNILCPQSLSPFPKQALREALAEAPEGEQTVINVIEYQGPFLFQQLQNILPEFNLRSHILTAAPEPLGLEMKLATLLNTACQPERKRDV